MMFCVGCCVGRCLALSDWKYYIRLFNYCLIVPYFWAIWIVILPTFFFHAVVSHFFFAFRFVNFFPFCWAAIFHPPIFLLLALRCVFRFEKCLHLFFIFINFNSAVCKMLLFTLFFFSLFRRLSKRIGCTETTAESSQKQNVSVFVWIGVKKVCIIVRWRMKDKDRTNNNKKIQQKTHNKIHKLKLMECIFFVFFLHSGFVS